MPSVTKIVSYYIEHVLLLQLFGSPNAVLYLRRVCCNILDRDVPSRRAMLEAPLLEDV